MFYIEIKNAKNVYLVDYSPFQETFHSACRWAVLSFHIILCSYRRNENSSDEDLTKIQRYIEGILCSLY